MSIEVKVVQTGDASIWDSYVSAHSRSTLYHLYGWASVIHKTYGHKSHYLMAIKDYQESINGITFKKGDPELSAIKKQPGGKSVVGILPLIHLKNIFFGKSLVSIPFFDLGGILADDEQTEKALFLKAIELAKELKVNNIELRHIHPLSWLDSNNIGQPATTRELSNGNWFSQNRSHKVRMLLNLPESSEMLMKSFKSKLRNQLRLPIKEGLKAKVGDLDLLDDFYKVFSINMRDLGSPVHSKKLMQYVLEIFPAKSKIVVVYKTNQPLACGLVVGFKGILENPWASALRTYSKLSPNMLLYWTMLEYACENGYSSFDFGRSSPEEGTYNFKEQWGARPTPLSWHNIFWDDKHIDTEMSERSIFSKAIQYWKKLPVPITIIMGPILRKNIGL